MCPRLSSPQRAREHPRLQLTAIDTCSLEPTQVNCWPPSLRRFAVSDWSSEPDLVIVECGFSIRWVNVLLGQAPPTQPTLCRRFFASTMQAGAIQTACLCRKQYLSAGPRFWLLSASSTPCISNSWERVSAGTVAGESYTHQA